MKNVLLAAVAALGLVGVASTASAFDLGYDFALDNTVAVEYNVNTEEFAVDYTANLNYSYEDFSVYVSTTVDLQDIDFGVAELGVNYEADGFTLYGFTTVDADVNWGDFYVGAKLEF